MWLPFAGEVAWEIDGKETLYWQGRIEHWEARTDCARGEAGRGRRRWSPLWTGPLGYLSSGPS